MDTICVEELELQSRIGVTEAEREHPQRLTISLRLEPTFSFAELQDNLRRTIDYAAVCEHVKIIASTGVRSLVETLADAIATDLLLAFPLHAVEIELRKYVLPDTRFVAVKIRRPSPD